MRKCLSLNLACCLLLGQLPVSAAVTPTDIQAALEKAKILSPGTGLSASVVKNQAFVSTYRNSQASERDCKIDATLIAKAIMDLESDTITTVVVFFYNRKDPSSFDQVTLSAGDIKAFGSGDLAKDQFLSSVKIEHHESDDAAKISSYIQASRQRMARRASDAKLENGTVTVQVEMEPWVPIRDLQYEAFRIAQNLFEAFRAQAVQKVQVVFTDPGKSMADRRVLISASDMQGIQQSIHQSLSALSVSLGAAPLLEVINGAKVPERKDLARRIIALKTAGVESSELEKAFFELQQNAKENNESKLDDQMKKLSSELTAKEKAAFGKRGSGQDTEQKRTSLTSEQILAAIDKANILPPGVRTSVLVKDREVVVGTYEQSAASEKDYKIDAVLISKAVTDLSPQDVASVTVCFYSQSDLSAFEEVRLSAGDIRAFAHGTLSRDQLLSSMKLERKHTEDIALAADYLQASTSRASLNPVQTSYNSGSIRVNLQLEPWIDEGEVQYEALRIVEKVVEANGGKPIKSIRIIFSDPNLQAADREITVTPNIVPKVEQSLSSSLASIDIAGPGATASSTEEMTVPEGAMKDERTSLHKRIEALKAAKVGVTNFSAYMKMADDAASSGDQKQTGVLVQKLSDALDQQEKTTSGLKNQDKVASTTTSSAKLAPVVAQPWETRWAMGGRPVLDGNRVARDADCYAAQLAATVPNASANPLYWHALRFFAQELRRRNQLEEAAKYDRRVFEMQKAYPGIMR